MDWRFGGRSSMGCSCADEDGDKDDGHGGDWVVAIRWKEMDLAEEREERREGGFDGRREMGSLVVKKRREREVVVAEAIAENRERRTPGWWVWDGVLVLEKPKGDRSD